MVEIFFEKERTAEHEGVDFEIEDTDTSAHLCWVCRKFCAKPGWVFFVCFFGDKKIAFKSSFDLYSHPLIIEFFWFV